MKKYILLFLAISLLIANPDSSAFLSFPGGGGSGSVYPNFLDYFNRSDNGTVGGGWDSEVDTQSNLAILSNELHFQCDSTSAAYVKETLASDYTEMTVKYKAEFDDVTGLGNNGYLTHLDIYDTSNNYQFRISFITDGSGDWKQMRVKYYDDGGSANLDSDAIAPAINTMYPVILYYKRATGVGANNGIAKLKFNGVEVISKTDIDNDTLNGIGQFRFGHILQGATWDEGAGLDIYYDDFESYDSNQY